jgi:hypothetical protein
LSKEDSSHIYTCIHAGTAISKSTSDLEQAKKEGKSSDERDASVRRSTPEGSNVGTVNLENSASVDVEGDAEDEGGGEERAEGQDTKEGEELERDGENE